MNKFAKLPIESLIRILGIQEDRRYYSLFRYRKGSDELVSLKDPDIRKYDVDYFRELDGAAKKRVRQLIFNGKYEHTAKICEIKTFIYLHFVLTDLTNGKAEHITFKEIGERTGCTERTVKASLNALVRDGFISYEKLNARYLDITLLGYKNMFKKAKDGGHGYFTMTSEACGSILDLKRLNDIRVALISIYESVRNEYVSPSKTLGALISFDEYKKALPEYLRPCHIRESVQTLSGVFGTFTETYKEFRVKLSGMFSARPIQNALLREARSAIRDHFISIRSAIDDFNRELESTLRISQECLDRLRTYGINCYCFIDTVSKDDVDHWKLKGLEYNTGTIESLAGIAVNFDLSMVLKAIGTFYENYILGDRAVDNLPGLITSIIKDNLKLQTEA